MKKLGDVALKLATASLERSLPGCADDADRRRMISTARAEGIIDADHADALLAEYCGECVE